MSDTLLIELFQRLGLALALGFLVGIERGWKHREAPDGARAAGIRTHAIIGLFGGLAGTLGVMLGEVAFAAFVIVFAGMWGFFKMKETEKDDDISATGAIAGLLLFAIGAYAAIGDMRVAAAAGVALTAILAFKEGLHSWLRALTWKEIRSALLILAATLIALPLLPDAAIDPWAVINPRELWVLTIFVAVASFAGYIAVRLLGSDVGLLAAGAAGAMVSSTVTTADLGRRVRAHEASAMAAAAAASIAAAVSIGRVMALVGVTARPLLLEAAPALATALVVFVAAAFTLRWMGKKNERHSEAPKLQSPLNLFSVLQFAAFLAAVIIIGRLVADQFGEAGLLPFAASAGLADVDAVTLAAGSLVRNGLPAEAGAHAVLTAVLVNSLSKGVIATGAGGPRYGGLYFAAALAAIAAGGVVWWLLR
jgi:uncharacterized membrane protein (DUF4010 family)